MRFVLGLCASSALLVSGCFLDHNSELPPEEPPDNPLPELVVVNAEIAGVTLGDDCPSTDGDIDSGACADDAPCPSLCQQSNLQLAIETVSADRSSLTWEVIEVTLHDFETGDRLQELTPRDPRVWEESEGYLEWDELLPVPSELSTTYDLQAPDWGSISGRIDAFWSHSFQVQMVVEIEGERRTLTSGAVYRVSDIDT